MATADGSSLGPLKLGLPGSVLFLELVLKEPLNPSSWTVIRKRTLVETALSDAAEASTFFTDVADAHQVPLEAIFISISQDADGCHNFINLGEVAAALLDRGSGGGEEEQRPLTQVFEEDVKAVREKMEIAMLYAKAGDFRIATATGRGLPIPMVDEMCPHASMWATNYSVIPELSVGLTQRMILCDERTLCLQVPEELIFEHLKLIVNCHQVKVSEGQYKIGACSSQSPPQVICQAVHRWFSLGAEDMNRANDEIQEAMWENLQHGTVAVHCLAGIHRAACIVACHFLWRYYVLGHTDLPSEARQIYNRLQAARPAVEPAYAHVLENYAAHLKRRCASACAR